VSALFLALQAEPILLFPVELTHDSGLPRNCPARSIQEGGHRGGTFEYHVYRGRISRRRTPTSMKCPAAGCGTFPW